jgi:hypothetical protein
MQVNLLMVFVMVRELWRQLYGKKYVGQWQNDVPHGQGSIKYPDGSEFVGQFENGRRNGEGEAKYADGTKYIGQWTDDLPNELIWP